jgi:hypothetical protein
MNPIQIREFVFQDSAPTIVEITEHIQLLSGLNVLWRERNNRGLTDKDEIIVDLWFEDFPKTCVEVSCSVTSIPIIILQKSIANEPTLFYTSVISLENLGGSANCQLSADLRKTYSQPLKKSTLKLNHIKHQLLLSYGCLVMIGVIPYMGFLGLFKWLYLIYLGCRKNV